MADWPKAAEVDGRLPISIFDGSANRQVGHWFHMPRLTTGILALAIHALTISCAVAASPETAAAGPDLPPQGSVKLSQLVAQAEGRPGFYAIKSISYSSNEYEIVYYMNDGAEVKFNVDVKTGEVRPPKRGGLFGN